MCQFPAREAHFVLKPSLIGNYKALEYSAEEKKYLLNTQIGVQVDVHVRGVPSFFRSLTYLSAYTLVNGL